MDSFPGDVIPVGARLIVDQQDQTVVKPARAEVVNLALNDGSQTDPGITNASERNHVGLTGQFALRKMMVGQLVDQESQRFTAAFDDHDRFIARETGIPK